MDAQLATDKLSHAYLFLGENGSGKEFLAREFAKYILCGKNEADDCPSCRDFSKGIHQDYIYVDGEEGIKIGVIREVIERINLSPSISKKKVLLLREAENLGIEAANALLKTIEEPPVDSVVILTATNEKALPETIISRCQTIKLRALTEQQIREILEKDFSKESVLDALDYSLGNLGETKRMLTDPDYLAEIKEVYSDIEVFLNSNSVIEKFKIVEKYDKSKKTDLKKFFSIFSKVIFALLSHNIKEEGDLRGGISLNGYGVDSLAEIANKILKISSELRYNINLKIALEEIIIDNTVS